MLLIDPRLAVDAGFALSVMATAAIVLLAPGWSRRLRTHGCWPLLADALAVSAAAGLATAPLVAGLNGTVSLVSLPANLLAAPAVAPATVLGLAAAVVSPVWTEAADVLVWVAGWPTGWLVGVAERAAALPDGALSWPAGTGGAVLLAAVVVAAGAALWRCPRLRPLALAALVGLVVLGWPLRQSVRGWPPPETVAVVCDVGQGDAIALPTGPGAAILIDAGPDVGAVDRCLDRLGITALPLVLVSHLDADHAAGLRGALEGRDVGVVATGSLSPPDDRVSSFAALVDRSGAERVTLVPGDRRTVGQTTVEVLGPDPRWATAAAAANDLSMVVRVTARGISLLLTGDLGAEAEARLRRSGTDLRADVLKVPHHGSADADPEFLAATGARLALVSVGADNTYGHPAPRLLRWLAEDGMQVLRTDQDGDVAVAGSAGYWGWPSADLPPVPVARMRPFHTRATSDAPAVAYVRRREQGCGRNRAVSVWRVRFSSRQAVSPGCRRSEGGIMARSISIDDITAHGPELSDEELAGIAGGRPCTCNSSKCIDIDAGTTDTDEDF